jgi:GNAT superfamily N-acetyltransferase
MLGTDAVPKNLSDKAIADYVVALHRRNSENLGFIPRRTIEDYAATGQIILADDGGCEAGYLLLGCGGDIARIYQACIEVDLRLLGLGRELVERAEALAKRSSATKIRLRCRDSLASNEFWTALGFDCVGTVPGGQRRGKMINIYDRTVRNSPQLQLGFGIRNLSADTG